MIKTKTEAGSMCSCFFLPKEIYVMQYVGEIYSLDSDYGQKRVNSYKKQDVHIFDDIGE